jgi:hypothetical protein
MFVYRIVWLTYEDHTYVDFIRDGLRRKSEERNRHPQLAAANRGAQGQGEVGFPFRRARIGGEIYALGHPLA